MAELFLPYEFGDQARESLDLEPEWPRRWMASWRLSGREVTCLSRDLDTVPVAASEPVRRFSWRARQRHRPGLEFMVSTGRLHGFESLEEQRLLLALDFVGVCEVLAQPFRLSFVSEAGRGEHVPDMLAILRDGSRWLFDVRPAELIGDEDVVRFAATAEVAQAVGWRYSVVTGWRRHVYGVLDAWSAQRRPLQDPLGLQPQLLEIVEGSGPCRFGDLVAATSLEAVARAHAIHLLWHRRLGSDLGNPLQDGSPVWAVAGGR